MTRAFLFSVKSRYFFQALFLCSLVLASSTRLKRNDEDDSDEIKEKIERRNNLLPQLYHVEYLMTKSVLNEGDTEKIEFLLKRFDSLWSNLVEKSEEIYYNCFVAGSNCLDEETTYQENLNKPLDQLNRRISRLLFVAQLRNCQSPDETYFEPINQCVPIGSTRYCPENMIVTDGPQNKGFCECVDSSELFVSAKTGRCYKQNTQGPCQNGKWLIVRDGNLVCQPIPKGCPADGQHVFWSPDAKLAKKCWKMGTQGPCPEDEILIGNGGLDVSCGQYQSAGASVAPIQKSFKCPAGSFLNGKRECERVKSSRKG